MRKKKRITQSLKEKKNEIEIKKESERERENDANGPKHKSELHATVKLREVEMYIDFSIFFLFFSNQTV